MKSRDINVLSIEGNLAADCMLKEIGESRLAKFRLCVGNGEAKTTFLDCEWWNPNGATEYLKKGKKVFLIGRLLQDEWEDKDTGNKRQKHFLGVDKLELRSNTKKEEESKSEAPENLPF